MKFQRKIPVLYYSITEDVSNDCIDLELKTLRTKFPDYNILTSKELFKEKDINNCDIVKSHSQLHHMTPEGFYASLNDKDLKKRCNEKEVGRHEHVEFLDWGQKSI